MLDAPDELEWRNGHTTAGVFDPNSEVDTGWGSVLGGPDGVTFTEGMRAELSQTTQSPQTADFAGFEASDAERQAVIGPVPPGADSDTRGSSIDYMQPIPGSEQSNLGAFLAIPEQLGQSESVNSLTTSPLGQVIEGGIDKLQAQADWLAQAAENDWNRLSTDPVGTLVHDTGVAINMFGEMVLDAANFVGDQALVLANTLSGGLIPDAGALERNTELTETVFGGIYNVQQAVENEDYNALGGLAVEGVEIAAVTLALRGKGRVDGNGDDIRSDLQALPLAGRNIWVNSSEIRWSQESVSFKKSANAHRIEYNLDDLDAQFRMDPDAIPAIDVVRMPDGKLTALDNSRLTVRADQGGDIKVNVFNYDDPLPDPKFAARFNRLLK